MKGNKEQDILQEDVEIKTKFPLSVRDSIDHNPNHTVDKTNLLYASLDLMQASKDGIFHKRLMRALSENVGSTGCDLKSMEPKVEGDVNWSHSNRLLPVEGESVAMESVCEGDQVLPHTESPEDDIEVALRPSQDSSHFPPGLTCDICLRIGSPKNSVRSISDEEFRSYGLCRVDDTIRGALVQPYILAANRSNCDVVRQCRACRRLFMKLAKENKRANNYQETGKTPLGSLTKSIMELTNRYNRFRYGQPQPVSSRLSSEKVCALKGKAKTACSVNTDTIYHPTRLSNLDDALVESWATEFAKSMGIEKEQAILIARECASLRLCSVHSGHMKRAITTVRANLRRCSVCCKVQDGFITSNVTPFDWEKVSQN